MFSAAEKAGAAAIMPWELVPWHVAPTSSGGFDFGIDDPSFAPAVQMIAWMQTRVLPLLSKQASWPWLVRIDPAGGRAFVMTAICRSMAHAKNVCSKDRLQDAV